MIQREREITQAAAGLVRNIWRAIFVVIVLGLASLATSGCVFEPYPGGGGYYGGGGYGGGYHHEHGGWR